MLTTPKINNKDNTKAQFIRNYFWGLEIQKF
jgi:hypothetical protein